MNSQVRKYYRKFGEEEIPLKVFHDVIPLHETVQVSWQEASQKAPDLPRGWFELSRLSPADRVNFTRDFWLETLPFVPHIHEFLVGFFSKLDDIGVFLVQQRFDASYQSELVYSLRDGSCFFHGRPPCTEGEVQALSSKFQEGLPEKYLAFLRIHDGFSKEADSGMIHSSCLCYLPLETSGIHLRSGPEVSPGDLIPFYESFDEKNYQCFYAGWAPAGEPGNVFYASKEQLISDMTNHKTWSENLAFPTFLDWLVFYLEGVEG